MNLIVAHDTIYKKEGEKMDNKTTGSKIKQARKRKGLTQKELAESINRTESSIRKYEKGLVEIPNSILEQIAVVLDVNVSDLMSWEDIPEIANYVYASDLIHLSENLSEKRYNFTDNEIEELRNKISSYIDTGNKIENIDKRQSYFFNASVEITHEMLDHIMKPYLCADILDIVDLISFYLSFTDSKQGSIIELLSDLHENQFLLKEYWENTKN